MPSRPIHRWTAAAGRRPGAVLVDLDGTLVDTEPVWSSEIARIAEAHGARWDCAKDGPLLVGMLVPDVATLLRARGVDIGADALIALLVDRVAERIGDDPPWRDGARELLSGLSSAAIPAALVTTSYRRHALAVADVAPTGAFRVVVAAEDVAAHKPDPEAYRTALGLLGVDASAAIALEDSPPGVRAALAAGVRTLAVQPSTTLPDDVERHPLLRRVDGLFAALVVLGLTD